MKKHGSVAISEVAAKTTHIDIACTRCDRRGHYQLAKLVAQFGPDFAMTDLARELTDCPSRTERAHNKRCDPYFPGLIPILYGDA